MRTIKVNISADGTATVDSEFLGYSGEHNVATLEIEFDDESYANMAYYRLIFDDYYTDQLYVNDNKIEFYIPQGVLKAPWTKCQVVGYQKDGTETSNVIKSEIFKLNVKPSQCQMAAVKSDAVQPLDDAMNKCGQLYELTRQTANEVQTAKSAIENSEEVALIAAENATNQNAEAEEYSTDALEFSLQALASEVTCQLILEDIEAEAAAVEENAQNATQALNDATEIKNQCQELLDSAGNLPTSLRNEAANGIFATKTGGIVSIENIATESGKITAEISGDMVEGAKLYALSGNCFTGDNIQRGYLNYLGEFNASDISDFATCEDFVAVKGATTYSFSHDSEYSVYYRIAEYSSDDVDSFIRVTEFSGSSFTVSADAKFIRLSAARDNDTNLPATVHFMMTPGTKPAVYEPAQEMTEYEFSENGKIENIEIVSEKMVFFSHENDFTIKAKIDTQKFVENEFKKREKKWQLIRTYTLVGETNTVTIETDANGDYFELCGSLLKVNATAGSGSVNAIVHHISDHDETSATSAMKGRIFGATGETEKFWTCRATEDYGFWRVVSSGSVGYSASNYALYEKDNSINETPFNEDTKIRKITITAESDSTVFHEGTEFELWGLK